MKALLVGEFSETLNKVSAMLADEYTVQMSTMQEESLTGMIKVVKPNIIVLHAEHAVDESLMNCLQLCAINIPIVLLTTAEAYHKLEEAFSGFHVMPCLEPHTADNVLGVCRGITANIKRTILIVDDSPVVLRNLKELLEEKFEIVLATSGAMAIDKVKQQHLDAILLDYDMPVMDGKETLTRIKELPEGKDLPVIFLTGVTDTDRIVEVLKQKPAGYVLKPPKRDKIIETLESAMK